MPGTDGVRVPPRADPARIPDLHELVEDARRQGSRIANKDGGKSVQSLFMPPLLSPVHSRMKIYWEEQFGPIIPIVPYAKIEAPINSIIHSPFGQQLSIFGTKIQPLAHLVNCLKSQVARININSKCQRGPDLFPFTGRKDSAKGDFSTLEIMSLSSSRIPTGRTSGRKNSWKNSITPFLRGTSSRKSSGGSAWRIFTPITPA